MSEDTQGGNGRPGEALVRTPAGEQTWLVQRTELIDLEPDDPRDVWVDVGEVVVAPRTRRRTIIEKALEIYPGAVPPRSEAVSFRVLDADSAAEIPVRWEVPPAPDPVLRIGS